MRIGVIESFHDGAVDAEILEATHAAVAVLKSQGALIRRLELPPLSLFTECGRTILQAESFAIHADWLRTRHQDYGKRGRRRVLVGALISAERYVRAKQIGIELTRQFLEQMGDLDVAVCVSSLALPCAIDDDAAIDRTYDRQARTPFNVMGVPAVSVPIGLSRSGLPIGLQLAGKPYTEGILYRAALGLETALALDMRPPMDTLLNDSSEGDDRQTTHVDRGSCATSA